MEHSDKIVEILQDLEEKMPFRTVTASDSILEKINENRTDGLVLTELRLTVSKDSDMSDDEIFEEYRKNYG